MSTRRLIWGFLVFLLMAMFVGQTLSQTRRYDRTRDRSEKSPLRDTALQQRQLVKNEDESMQQALKATPEQWKAIEPKLKQINDLTSRANVSIKLMCVGIGTGSMGRSGSSFDINKGIGRMYGSGYSSNSDRDAAIPFKDTKGQVTRSSTYYGWRWIRPSQRKGLENLDEGEKICEELFSLLKDSNPKSEAIRQKTEALRKFRQQAKEELAIAQKQLRDLVTPYQEATLIMMGLLD